MARWETYQKLAVYSLHLMLYYLVKCFQSVYWRAIGIQNHLDKCRSGEEYEMSAQLLKVWSSFAPTFFILLYRRHFITTHDKFVHPEYALQKHITLMTVTDKEAIFCVPSPQENVLNVRKWPFLFWAQYLSAEYILIMPICSFNRLADCVGDPKTKVIWIHNQGRCGSTAMAQAFNALPDTVVIAESLCIMTLNQTFKYRCYREGKYNWEDSNTHLQKIYQSSVRLLLKPSLKPAEIVVVKGVPMTMMLELKLIPKLFPNICNLFMYREAEPQVLSLYRALSGYNLQFDITNFVASHPLLSKLFPHVKPLVLLYNSCSDKIHTQWLFGRVNSCKFTEYTGFVAGWAETTHHFKRLAQDTTRKPIPAFKYEHWLADQEKYLKVLFDCIELELTEQSLHLLRSALDEDSQKNTYMSRERVKQRHSGKITADMIEEANRYLRFYELPEWGESITLPNTITSF